MPKEIQEIIDGIVVVQLAVPVPAGQEDIQVATDEIPADITTGFPVFVNVEQELLTEDSAGAQAAGRGDRWTIMMHLLFASADQTYAIAERRPWVNAVRSHFRQNPSLNGQVVTSWLERIDFNPVEWGEAEYIATNFTLMALTDPSN